MLRGVVKQLTSVLLSASSKQSLSQLVTTTSASRETVALFHTNNTLNSNKSFNSERDSVRQKGTDVTPDSSQQISFTNTSAFGGVRFPTAETLVQSFDGVPFNQIPVVHIKATSNNTIVSVADGDGNVLCIQSAGTVGFRNARKGTNVAAQAAAITLADDALRKEIKQVRVCVKGIGPGRFPALKAIEMSGIKVVSITDTTPLPHNGNRPKKVRRL